MSYLGNETENDLPDKLYYNMWYLLKKALGERLDDKTLELMAGIETAVKEEYQQTDKEVQSWI